jgi:hypothetical protein
LRSFQASADFSVPVSKLHSITGTLVDARTGHIINAGSITFSTVPAADGSSEELGSARVDNDDPTFRVDFIPEGNYLVHVTGARDVIREAIPLCAGCVGIQQFKEIVVKHYASYEGPYMVQNDAVGVTFPIPASRPGISPQSSASEQ